MRTVPLVSAASFPRKLIEVHPNRNNPDAPLFVTNRRRETGSKPEDKKLIHKPLDQAAIMNVVYKTAKLAGITKRVYPHLFRHTCATELSKDFSESELRNFLGWAPGSAMVSVYVNLTWRAYEKRCYGQIWDRGAE